MMIFTKKPLLIVISLGLLTLIACSEVKEDEVESAKEDAGEMAEDVKRSAVKTDSDVKEKTSDWVDTSKDKASDMINASKEKTAELKDTGAQKIKEACIAAKKKMGGDPADCN